VVKAQRRNPAIVELKLQDKKRHELPNGCTQWETLVEEDKGVVRARSKIAVEEDYQGHKYQQKKPTNEHQWPVLARQEGIADSRIPMAQTPISVRHGLGSIAWGVALWQWSRKTAEEGFITLVEEIHGPTTLSKITCSPAKIGQNTTIITITSICTSHSRHCRGALKVLFYSANTRVTSTLVTIASCYITIHKRKLTSTW
jgi:hypothetical protein